MCMSLIRNNERVEKFGPEGEFLFAWGWGVADGHTEASADVYDVCASRGLSGAGAWPVRLRRGCGGR